MAGLVEPALQLHGRPLTRTPGSPQRVLQMVELREHGWSLHEIAVRFEVSRERVRQILLAHGAPELRDVAEARRCRAESLAAARVDEVLALWRAGEGPSAIAERLRLQTAACGRTIERFATDVDRAARTAGMAGAHGARTYSDRDIVLALRSVAARLGRAPRAQEYTAAASGARLPSLATVLHRMGGWSNALTVAGMEPTATPGRARRPRWSDDACWEALRQAHEELGAFPTVRVYERYAAGREDMPSSATIRNRLGRWTSLATRLAAERELAEQARVRTHSAHRALTGA
jgi:hypothetical protein